MSASESYSPDLLSRAKEFWYIFDKRYLRDDHDLTQLFLNCNLLKLNPATGGLGFNLDWMFFLLKNRMRADPLNYEQSFSIEVSPYKDGIVKLANDQRQIINDHLRDFIEIQQAFELFGQVVLYDERRGTVHKMDGTFPRHLVGYRRWHGFIKAAVSVGQAIDFWLNLDRSMLIAYLLQSKLKPLDTKQNNPYVDKETLTEYESSCMSLDFKSLDEAYNYYFP